MNFTESLEDYLLVLYENETSGETARVKNISEKLNKKHSSVIEALKKLEKTDYVEYQKYGPIRITKKGMEKAQKIYQKRMFLERFLNIHLKIESEEAKELATKLEHIDSENFIKGLQAICSFLETQKDISEKFEDFIIKADINIRKNKKRLVQLNLNEKARVLELNGDKDFIKKRLIAMGILPGVEIELSNIAPLGDPIEIVLKGYNLALRKDEAAYIFVEKG